MIRNKMMTDLTRRRQFDTLLDELDNPVQAPPVVNPTYWTDKLDDAQQMGYIDGFNAANDPSRVPLAILVGIVIGFLAGFFTFYRG